MSDVTHIFGLDLGQVADYSALCLLERAGPADLPSYACRYLHRWPRGTPYPEVVKGTIEKLTSSKLVSPILAIDNTGVGRGVVDLFRWQGNYSYRAITITSGQKWSLQPDGGYHVPKKELVGCLQTLMGYNRLGLPRELPNAKLLIEEMQKFRVKITTAANEVFGAWREGDHDDLVLAVAMAAWVGETACSGPLLPQDERSFSEVSRRPEGLFLDDSDLRGNW